MAGEDASRSGHPADTAIAFPLPPFDFTDDDYREHRRLYWLMMQDARLLASMNIPGPLITGLPKI